MVLTVYRKGKGGEAAPTYRAAIKNDLFPCEGPECNGRWVSYLNGGCAIHPFRDDWNKQYNSAARASGTIPERLRKEKTDKADPWVRTNPNIVNRDHVTRLDKKAKAKAAKKGRKPGKPKANPELAEIGEEA